MEQEQVNRVEMNQQLKLQVMEIKNQIQLTKKALMTCERNFSTKSLNDVDNYHAEVHRLQTQLTNLQSELTILDKINHLYWSKGIKTILFWIPEKFLQPTLNGGYRIVIPNSNISRKDGLFTDISADDVRSPATAPTAKKLLAIHVLKKYTVANADFEILGVRIRDRLVTVPGIEEISTQQTQKLTKK